MLGERVVSRWLFVLLVVAGCGVLTPSSSPIEISTLELPEAVRGTPYEVQLTATGGSAPLAFSAAAGSQLPAGLRLNSRGLLSGTPQQAGTFSLSVEVSDRSGGRASAGFLLVVVDEARARTTSTCAEPFVVALQSDTTVLEGSFASAVDVERLSCTSGAREQVYVFDLAEPADLIVEDLGRSGTTATARALQTTCGANESLACSSVNQTLLLRRAVGRLFLLVENSSGDPGASFAVMIRKVPPTPVPPNDRCSAATPLSLASPSVPLPGTLRGASADLPGSVCGSGEGRDVWFSLPIRVPSRVSLERSGVRAELFSGRCEAPSSPTCVFGGLCADLPPGDWRLRVVGNEDDFLGSLRHEPIPEPPANDTCATATPLQLSSGRATVNGRLWGARSDVTLPCSTGVDVTYELVVTERSNLTVDVSHGGDGVVTAALTDRLCTVALSCDARSSPSVRVWAVPPGTYRLVVHGSSGGSCWEGRFTAIVNLTPAPPAPANDTCATAEDVIFSNGLATVQGTTAGGANDDVVGCNQPAYGPDVVYRVTVTAPTRLRVIPTVRFQGMTAALTAAPCGSTQLQCLWGFSNNFETSVLAPGTYFLIVDGTDQAGPFQFIVQQFQ
jgi:hypothetical protein